LQDATRPYPSSTGLNFCSTRVARTTIYPPAGYALAVLSGNPIMIIGAGLSAAGYFAKNPLLSTVGGITMGFGGGGD